jgi:hypothetical protein
MVGEERAEMLMVIKVYNVAYTVMLSTQNLVSTWSRNSKYSIPQ